MRGVDRVGSDRAIAVVAGRQHGAISWRQLRWAGLSADAIAYRATNGRLHGVHRGVYLVGHVAAPPLGRDFAAVLACGEAALLSHESAAALWGFGPASPLPHVIAVGRDPGRRAGIGVHRARRLEGADARTRERIPVTSPARTLLDVAGGEGGAAVSRMIERARLLRMASDHDLAVALTRYRGHRGAGRLRAALGDDGRPNLIRSEAERLLLALVRRARIAPAETNVPLHGYEVDFLWREASLVLETDGFETHGTRNAFERDRRRDAHLTAAGFRVMRVTWRQIRDEPEAVIARLAAALAR